MELSIKDWSQILIKAVKECYGQLWCILYSLPVTTNAENSKQVLKQLAHVKLNLRYSIRGRVRFGAGHFGAGTIRRQNFFFRFVVL